MRIGVVGYLNALPLADGLPRHLPGAVLVRDDPAAVARGLERGSLDLGLVPVAALAEGNWPVVDGLGIASRGPVRSVLLLASRGLAGIEALVEDPASRTSNVLARLWLSRHLEREVAVEPGEGSVIDRLARGQATVVIGERALEFRGDVPVRIDLGAAWDEWTALPFVYAQWAGPAAARPEVQRALHRCYEENRVRIPELAARAAGGDASRKELIESYLSRNIRYRIGEAERAGRARYLELARDAGLLPVPCELSHADPDPT